MTSHKSTPGITDAAWTEQERELLGAARAERMPSQVEARLREALELQLGAATISGVHAARGADSLVPRASPPSEGAARSPQPLAQSASALDRSARVSQLFSSKLPLWGVLSALALGSFAYLGLRSAPPTLAVGSVGHGALAANDSRNGEHAASALHERAVHDGAVTPTAANAATSGGGRAAEASDEPAASHAANAADSGRGRISGATTGAGFVAAGDSGRAASASREASAASAVHAAGGGNGRVASASREAVAASAVHAAGGGNGRIASASREAVAASAVHAAGGGNARAASESRAAVAARGARASRSGSGRAWGESADVAARDPKAAATSGAREVMASASERTANGSRRAQDGVSDAAAQARAARSGGDRALGGAREAGAALAPRAADGGDRVSLDAGRGAAAVAGAQLDGDALRLEAELLDGARRALSRAALQEARALLGQYSARFERGVLKPERDVLRIELEMRTGADRAAHSHAASFLASYPNHPLRERVRELVTGRGVTAVE